MRVNLLVDGRCLRNWHGELARKLAGSCDVSVEFAGDCPPASSAAEILFAFETGLHRLPPVKLAARAARASLDGFLSRPACKADLTIDLCGVARAGPGRVWQLTFDGAPGEAGLIAALAQGRMPLAALRENGRTIAAGRLGNESYGLLSTAFELSLIGTATLVAAAVCGNRGGAALRGEAPAPAVSVFEFAARAARDVLRSTARRLHGLRHRTPHWRTGWRKLAGPDVLDLRAHPAGGWRELPDDGLRFYADPFPIEVGGRLTLFVEEYPHATRRGLVSAVEFGPEGPLGRPEPVLQLPYHLSYPFVFERDGEIWMIPESGANGTIDLFRATRFPGGWVREATLVANIVAADATLLERDGRWWMFATVQSNGGCHSDALHLWSAPDFRGPWTAHKRNPVLIDVAAARPAGRIVLRDGALWRPAQDCRKAYGGALALARILQLDDEGFEQQVETVIGAGPLWEGKWLHTLNRAGGFEFIDGEGVARRF